MPRWVLLDLGTGEWYHFAWILKEVVSPLWYTPSGTIIFYYCWQNNSLLNSFLSACVMHQAGTWNGFAHSLTSNENVPLERSFNERTPLYSLYISYTILALTAMSASFLWPAIKYLSLCLSFIVNGLIFHLCLYGLILSRFVLICPFSGLNYLLYNSLSAILYSQVWHP